VGARAPKQDMSAQGFGPQKRLLFVQVLSISRPCTGFHLFVDAPCPHATGAGSASDIRTSNRMAFFICFAPQCSIFTLKPTAFLADSLRCCGAITAAVAGQPFLPAFFCNLAGSSRIWAGILPMLEAHNNPAQEVNAWVEARNKWKSHSRANPVLLGE